ncbi:MAG: rhodanese-like domain-containing protein [Acidobacteria bacterium]|nr:rhodanese-like domain-containing protein [Acidobacteriota bacterium]
MIKQATVHEINELLDSGGECQVIDVREFSEFNSERIADAQLMPLSNFEKHADEIDHTKPVYLMCRSGNRAKNAAEKLASKGFTDIHVVEGGMVAWAGANLPVVKGESKVWSLERQVRFAAGMLCFDRCISRAIRQPVFSNVLGSCRRGLDVFGRDRYMCDGNGTGENAWNKAPVTCEPAK